MRLVAATIFFFVIVLHLSSANGQRCSCSESGGTDDPSILGSISRKIQEHMNSKKPAARSSHDYCSCCYCRNQRAGCAHAVAPWAKISYAKHYRGYYVGGGVPSSNFVAGDSRCVGEGTWGVDYAPWYSKVALLWTHGRLYQGGTGQYEPEHRNWPFGQMFGKHNLRHSQYHR